MRYILAILLVGSTTSVLAQEKPEDTEVWSPAPKKVTPAKVQYEAAPSDAVVLFNGKDEQEWVLTSDRNKPATWDVKDSLLRVNKSAGNIETKRLFTNYQLHIEWRIPDNISGSGQERGNSGVFLASLGKRNAGYELQILDSYGNDTYINGMAGAIYKEFVPLVNAALKPGEWQVYDVVWMAPVFNADGSLQSPAKATVFFNGVLVQNNVALTGPTMHTGKPSYKVHGAAPIKLQSHGDKSEPISFRNIWVREL
ncbi:DUF1080 domain-containing protein [Chitinophaga sp. SYP-B3965]|uniref:3-keto-disaccharide hydrolase n=1 Tax=Chitinophaga sp. SYP-B3965 TaxID=2663120 RepID=UPI001299EFF0|nr:DUF1080 domain-containing protein [Chitinophaga sp. SYP-B3965]MRG48042.1 DUF1080 domain-containing protein [Chitinophaga sp. SYP-B3965]